MKMPILMLFMIFFKHASKSVSKGKKPSTHGGEFTCSYQGISYGFILFGYN
jgi:hypothetical protein